MCWWRKVWVVYIEVHFGRVFEVLGAMNLGELHEKIGWRWVFSCLCRYVGNELQDHPLESWLRESWKFEAFKMLKDVAHVVSIDSIVWFRTYTHTLSRQVGVAQRVIISGLVAVLKSWKKMNPAKCTHYTISIVHRRSLVILEASPGNAFQTFLFMAMLRNSLMMIFKHLLGPKRAMTPPDSPKPLVQRAAQRPKC